MTDFNDRIAALAELEAKATPGPWKHMGTMDIYTKDEVVNQKWVADCNTCYDDAQFIPALRNEAMPLLREMQQALSEARAENERLRDGLKTMAANFAEMEKLRSQFYTEKEQAETALLFANRERDALKARVDWVLNVLYAGEWDMMNQAIKILTGEGE